VEVAEFADLASLAGKPAQIAVSVTRARRVEWRRLRVIGRGAEGERPDRTIRAAEKAPNIVVYVVDALRPDALSAYGGPIPTPAFDSLAQDGARFEPALTTSTWTRPATASLLTGLYPSAHGALDRPHVLAESLFTLPDRLRLLGYRTVAVVANGNIDRVWGFGQGFETFVLAPYPAQTTPGVPEHPRAGQLHGIALEEWARQGDDRPLFLYIHTVDPHGPYNPPEWLLERPRPDIYERNTEKILAGLNTRQVAPEPGLLTALRDLYLGEVAYADRELGRFLEQIRTPEGGNTLFLLTADHGEARMEHGFASHGMSLHREELEIPLLLWGPGRIPEGRTINQPVSLIDVAPTVLAAAGGAATALPGTDLARLAGGGQVERSLFAELDYDGRRWSALVEGRWALLHQVGRERFLLFDWEADRGETQDLSEAHPQLVEQLATSLEVLRRQVLSSSVAEPALLQGRPDEEVIENLRALGYVE
jgi:arylsulfatase